MLEHSGAGSLLADSQNLASTRVQTLLEFLRERELDLEDVAERKRVSLHQCVQLRHLENEARQVSYSLCNLERRLLNSCF